MKKCPFCAESIQGAAIKCKHCGSMVSAVPTPAPAVPSGFAAIQRAREPLESEVDDGQRRFLYSGFPSWRAYFGEYVIILGLGIIVPLSFRWVSRELDASTFTVALSISIPLTVAVVALLVVGIYRRSKIVRISTTNIETEYGILSKKIDVLELWRCRDVRYKQSLFDRILGIAHIEIYTTDVTTPNLEVVGLPASRLLFEKIRDSIEIQRHSRNVVGFVQ